MLLKQTGDSISGVYTYQNGQLEGTLLADSFSLKWWEFALSNCPYDSAEIRHRGPGFFNVKKEETVCMGDGDMRVIRNGVLRNGSQ